MAPPENVAATLGSARGWGWSSSGTWLQVCGRLAVPLALAGLVLLAGRLASSIDGPAALLLGAVGLAAGWATADLVSGLVHWWADRIASEDTPWIGPGFVRPFREHHEAPVSICRYGFLDTNGNTCIVALPPLAAALCLVPPVPEGPGAVLATAWLVSFGGWSCLTNQIHKWAHQPRVPRALRWLQRRGVLLSREHHAGHHAPPYATRYCITAGRCDFLLEALRLLPAVERRLGREPPRPRSAAAGGPGVA